MATGGFVGLLQSLQPRQEGSAAQSMLVAGSQHISNGWKSITLPRLLPGLTQAAPNSTGTSWKRDRANKLRPSLSVTSTKPSSTTGCEGFSAQGGNHNSLTTCRFCSSSEGAALPNPPRQLWQAQARWGKSRHFSFCTHLQLRRQRDPRGHRRLPAHRETSPAPSLCPPSPSVRLFTARGPGKLSGSSTPPHPSQDRGSRSWGGSASPLTWAEKSISFGSGCLFPSSLFRKSSKLPADREGRREDGSAAACAHPQGDTDPTGSQGAEHDSRTQSGNIPDLPPHSQALTGGGAAPLWAPSCLVGFSSLSAPVPIPPSPGLSLCPLRHAAAGPSPAPSALAAGTEPTANPRGAGGADPWGTQVPPPGLW